MNLDLEIGYSGFESLNDEEDSATTRVKKRKKRIKRVAPSSTSEEFSLLLHITVMQINPTRVGGKTMKEILAKGVEVCNYINEKVCWSDMSAGTTLHCINIVGEIRIPCLVGADIEKFDSDFNTNVIRNGDIKIAGKAVMKINPTKDLIKFPSMRIQISHLYGAPNFDVTLQFYESGFVSVTGAKTYSALYAAHAGVVMLMYLAAPDRRRFLRDLERSKVDSGVHNHISCTYDKNDIGAKFDEDYKKEKISSGTGGGARSAAASKQKSAAAKQITFRKSDLANPKEKFAARHNAKFATNFHRLASSDFRTTEWMSDVLGVFNYHTFSDTAGFGEWLRFVQS